MTRAYTDFCNDDVHTWLKILADKSIEPTLYKKTMTQLGSSLGDCILDQIDNKESDVYLASTVEDADFLAKGIRLFIHSLVLLQNMLDGYRGYKVHLPQVRYKDVLKKN